MIERNIMMDTKKYMQRVVVMHCAHKVRQSILEPANRFQVRRRVTGNSFVVSSKVDMLQH